jgi:hypothetical protein
MARSNRPNRTKALILGIVGGLVGMAARRYYDREIAPDIFGREQPPRPADPALPDPVESRAMAAPYYRDGESDMETSARLLYALRNRREISPDTQKEWANALDWAYGTLVGAMYGGTRTTTRARDFAGGFFFGIRLWLGQIVGLSYLGLRPGPTRYSAQSHLRLLASIWVYSFTSTLITRLLYRLFSPQDWGIFRRK